VGGETDLSLRAVLEAVLDSKGFEEFKSKVEQAADDAKRSSAGAQEAGGHFDSLGRRLPHAAFDILSREMLRNAGIQQGLGPLTRISTGALESLAAAGKLTGSAFAGATLGLSLLIPLIAMLTMKSDEAKETTAAVKEDTDSLVEAYEQLRAKTGHLTKAQQEYLDVLREVQKEERRAAEESIQAQIREQEKLIKSTLSLWGATKLLVSGMVDHQIKGEKFESVEDRMATITDKARKEIERLGTELVALKGAHDAGFKSAGEQARAELDVAEKAEIAAKKVKEAAQKVADFQLQLSQRLAQERAALNLEAAATTADREKAIAEQEAVILEDQIHSALKAGATERQLLEMRAVSHTRVLLRIRAEETKWAKDREKMIEDGIAKNREGAQAVIANLEKIAAVERAEHDAKVARQEQNVDLAQAGVAVATTLFGKNKSVAIAGAIMDTYAAANKALNNPPGPPWSLIYVALAIATGLKNVQAIRSSTPEAGFDDPVNDLLARDYGRRWAGDFMREVGRGFSGGLRDGESRGGSVIHQRTTINRGTNIGTANFNGLLGTPNQAMLDFERRQIKSRRVENRTRRRSKL